MALLVNLNGNLDSSSRDRDYRDYYSQPIYYFVPFYTYLQAPVQVYEGDLLSSPLSQELPTGEYTFLDCAKTLSIPLDSNQGSPGISEITRGRFFFLSRPGHPPTPGPKTDMSGIFREKHIWIWYLLQDHCVFVYALCRITTKHTC